jgi:hypothetical protein
MDSAKRRIPNVRCLRGAAHGSASTWVGSFWDDRPKWQHIGDWISAAFVFARSNFINVHQMHRPWLINLLEISSNHRVRQSFWHRSEADWHFSEKPIHLTGAECWPAQKLETGWLFALASAFRPRPDSVWQLVRARERRRPLNQLERTG